MPFFYFLKRFYFEDFILRLLFLCDTIFWPIGDVGVPLVKLERKTNILYEDNKTKETIRVCSDT